MSTEKKLSAQRHEELAQLREVLEMYEVAVSGKELLTYGPKLQIMTAKALLMQARQQKADDLQNQLTGLKARSLINMRQRNLIGSYSSMVSG